MARLGSKEHTAGDEVRQVDRDQITWELAHYAMCIGKVMSKAVTCSNLHFIKIPLAAVWRVDHAMAKVVARRLIQRLVQLSKEEMVEA